MILLGFIIAQIIIFAIIIFVLKRLIFNDTTSAVNRLTELDNMNREKEKQLVTRLEETEKLLQQKREQLATEEKKMKAEAQRAANELHDSMVNKAKGEADDILKKAVAVREKMKTDALIEAEGKIIDFCKEILGKTLSPIVANKIDGQLLDDFLAELEKTDMGIIQPSVRSAEIATARKLDEAIVKKVQETLKKKLGRDINVKVREDASLIGGMSLKFGTLVIDDTMQERFSTQAAELKDSLSWKHNKGV